MNKTILAAIALAATNVSGSVAVAQETWNDGMMFVQQELASVIGHKAVKIIFGLEPGKCTGEITAVSEWLIMREGTMVQSYPDKGEFERKEGDEWYQPNGTRVVVCNKSSQRAVLEGVQFRPNK